MSNRGRPTKGTGKKYTRTVTSTFEIEQFLHKHREIVASDLFQKALESIMPKDQDVMRMKELEVQVREQRAALAMMEFELAKIKDEVRKRQELQVEIRIEADIDAWYLRSLLERKIITIPSRMPLDEAIERAIARGHTKIDELEKIKGEWHFTEKASESTKYHWTSLYDSVKGTIFDRSPTISTSEHVLKESYFLIFKPGKFYEFQRSIVEGQLPEGEIPLDFLKKYEPKIISERLKEDLRKKMLPFYDGSYERIDLEVEP